MKTFPKEDYKGSILNKAILYCELLENFKDESKGNGGKMNQLYGRTCGQTHKLIQKTWRKRTFRCTGKQAYLFSTISSQGIPNCLIVTTNNDLYH